MYLERDMDLHEFKSVKIKDTVYELIHVYDLQPTMRIIDHNDEYGRGDSAEVITDIDFGGIFLFPSEGDYVYLSHGHDDYLEFKRQIKNHIFDDVDFMDWLHEKEFSK